MSARRRLDARRAEARRARTRSPRRPRACARRRRAAPANAQSPLPSPRPRRTPAPARGCARACRGQQRRPGHARAMDGRGPSLHDTPWERPTGGARSGARVRLVSSSMAAMGESERALTQQRTTLVSIAAAALLVGLKLGVGLATGSLGLVSAGVEASGAVGAGVL